MINLSQLIKGRKKLFLVISVVSALLLPSIWFGLGHVIAKQALAVPHGCGMESNTPTNWTVDDDWESFEPWADSEQRISMRKDFDANSGNSILMKLSILQVGMVLTLKVGM